GGLDDDFQCLAAITVGGVHLQIAAIVLQRRSAELLIPQCLDDLSAAQKRAPQFAALLDGPCLSAVSDRALDCGRGARFQHFQDTRVEEGPTWGILRSAPSGWRYDSSGAGSSAMASAA